MSGPAKAYKMVLSWKSAPTLTIQIVRGMGTIKKVFSIERGAVPATGPSVPLRGPSLPLTDSSFNQLRKIA